MDATPPSKPTPDGASPPASPPTLSLLRLFARFLRYGVLAWGGPVAQIGMLKHELVDEERWVEPRRFNRVLAVYQALPGPEASELCVYFGMLARGRIGGLLAGLGFMLPGTLFVLGAAWFYVEHGIDGRLAAAFAGAQVAAVALVLRAVHRIGSHALHARSHWIAALVVFALLLVPIGGGDATSSTTSTAASDATTAELARVGLAAGTLSFGGAYTSVGFVHAAAVERTGWLTDEQFLDAIAVSGALPSPLIVFATFVGYVAGGLTGAIVMTAMIFLPAFAITLLGHTTLERIVDAPRVHRILDLITAAVVGLIAATAVTLFASAIDSVATFVLFAAGLATLVLSRSRAAIVLVVFGSALAMALLDVAGVA
jgi:chromate transporter